MDHVEPMDLDNIESDFDNKENTYQHNNALTTITHNNRVSSIERGYEELDVSELGMKLRYSVTPISSPMSKSFTANCLDNRNISSVEDAIIINNQNLTRSLNSSMINSDSILKSLKSLPLQSLPTDQFKDLNRNASVRRSLDGAKNNITVTINTPLDTDDNLSLPSTSSSLAHTPEATTPTKEIPKQDGGSPILRGLKSVLSMFRSSQSPIPPYDDTNKKNTDASLSESQVTDIKTQTVRVSPPIRSKNSPLKSGSPLKDSVVFKDDLERELQWKDDYEIIFKDEKIPIQKLFLQVLPYEFRSVNKLTNDNINTTVADISFNEPPDEPLKSDAMNHTNHTVDSDSEFQDCETTFTKTEGDAIENKTVNISKSHSQGNINMSIVENEYTEVKLEESSVTSQPQAELKPNQSINIQSVENNFAHSQQVPKDVNTYETLNIETELSKEILQDIVENTQNVNTSQLNAKEDISSQLSCDKTNETKFSSEQESIENKKSEQILVENQCDILSEVTKINSNTASDPLPSPYNINNFNESCTGNDNANMSVTGKECKEVKLDQIELNVNQTIHLENDIVNVQSIQEGMKLSETIEIDIQNIVENIQYNNTIDNNIEQDMLLKMSIDKTLMAISTTDLDIDKNKCEQTIAKNENDISKNVTEIGCNTNIEINPLNSVSNIQTNKDVDNVCELQHEVLSNNLVFEKTIDMNQAKELVNNLDSIDETIRKLDHRNEKNVHENNEDVPQRNIITNDVNNISEITVVTSDADKNFNPFASRSKICVSPTPTNTTIVHDISSNQDICNNTHNITSNIEKHGNITEKNDYSEISNITSSSKHTDETNDIVKQIHTEDEDTIEGPFLDAEALAELEQDANILPESEKDNIIDFDNFPSQINEDNMDNAEIFIDAEAFEFLLNQNKSNMVVDSGNESLFLKFDPLYASKVPSDGILAALNKVLKRVSTPKKTKHKVDNILLTDNLNAGTSSNVTSSIVNEEDINVNVSKPTMIVNPAVNPIISPRKTVMPPKINRQSLISFTSPAMAIIDRLLSISGNSPFLNHDTAMQRASAEQHQTDLALIQLREMLAEKELHVQTQRSENKELKGRLSVMESQVRFLETESQERLRKVTGLNNKLSEATKVNQIMSAVVEEYERTIASLVAELEQDKRRNAEERMKLIRDRDEQTAHLASMELSFSDLHSKYEKSKQIILSLKANEDAYKKSVTEFEDSLEEMQNIYELLKQYATSKLNHANKELEKINRAHEAEVLKLNTMIKRKDMHITSLEETLAQKTKANDALTAICDELINKVC